MIEYGNSQVTVSIASGQSLSTAVEIGAGTIVGIIMPAAWTAAGITLQTAFGEGGTFVDVHDSGGEFAVTVGASQHVLISPDSLIGLGTHIKLRSGTSGTPVNQAEARSIILVTRLV